MIPHSTKLVFYVYRAYLCNCWSATSNVYKKYQTPYLIVNLESATSPIKLMKLELFQTLYCNVPCPLTYKQRHATINLLFCKVCYCVCAASSILFCSTKYTAFNVIVNDQAVQLNNPDDPDLQSNKKLAKWYHVIERMNDGNRHFHFSFVHYYWHFTSPNSSALNICINYTKLLPTTSDIPYSLLRWKSKWKKIYNRIRLCPWHIEIIYIALQVMCTYWRAYIQTFFALFHTRKIQLYTVH